MNDILEARLDHDEVVRTYTKLAPLYDTWAMLTESRARKQCVERLALQRLTPNAVDALTAGSGLDADRVFEMTEGNPYFVSELVASADEASVPPTVVDAVTGRLRRLDPDTQEHVEQLAVVPSAVDADLLARLVPGSAGALRGAEEGGLLDVSPDGVRFRHELTRRAVVDSLPAWDLKPGRWVVDASIALPESAEPGIYTYELQFDSPPVSFDKRLTFVVRAR